MKINLVLFTVASLYVFTACNNSSETTPTSIDSTSLHTDTSSLHNDTSMASSSDMQSTTQAGSGLMKAMSDMMTKMKAVPMSGDFDADFANMMIEHHQGALDMAQVEVSQGANEKMKAMAQKILIKQKEEQEMLRSFVTNYKPSGMKHGEGDLQKSMADMSEKMKAMQMGGTIDKDFATMMISHHEGGMAMQKLEVENGMSDKMKQMAQKGIIDHKKEISEFKAWLSSNK